LTVGSETSLGPTIISSSLPSPARVETQALCPSLFAEGL